MGRKLRTWRDWALIIIARYWLFQGMRYMNWVERGHRLILESLLGVVCWLGTASIAAGWWRGLLSVVLAHTATVILNGHLFALFKHDLYWFGFYRDPGEFQKYVDSIQARLRLSSGSALLRAEIYGSLTRGEFRDTSDLDLRLTASPGLWNAVRVAHLVFLERLRALLNGFPLDIYMFRTEGERRAKINVSSEAGLVLFPRTGRLELGIVNSTAPSGSC